MNISSFYRGSPNLKRVGTYQEFTEEQVIDFDKCSKDPIYFIEKYVRLVTLDRGFVPIQLYPFQKEALNTIHSDRKVIIKAGRQVGKTSTIVGYLLWYIIFNEDQTVAVLANKASTAREILGRIKLAYESLPTWLQQGIKSWNKGDIELENNSRIFANSTASTAIRGFTISLLYLDEFAFVPNNIAEEFFTSVYPTISSGTKSKIIISSTPNGMNHFYKMWSDAEQKRNGFSFISAIWSAVPGRDQAWADDQRKALGDEKFEQEMNCEFLGSSGTLISSRALKNLALLEPIYNSEIEGLQIYYQPEKMNSYILISDTSRGKGIDYSAFCVIDISQLPYRLVCVYIYNNISPLIYPSIIKKIGTYYNNAYVLVEINDNGQQVVDLLFDEWEYENIICTETKDKRTHITFNSSSDRGLRTTKTVKRLGCSILKNLIEDSKLIVNDFYVISELSTFIRKKTSYEADDGSNDDLVMCLVLFAWMTGQEIFGDMTNTNFRDKIYQEHMRRIEDEFLPMPKLEDHSGEGQFIEDGALWGYISTGR